MNIGVLLYTHNRLDDARINEEIIRSVWKRAPFLDSVRIVHSYNGSKEAWPKPYLEDALLHLPNPGHLRGAELLLDEGVRCFSERYPETDYVIILAADTWLLRPEYIEHVIRSMKKDRKYLATCAWGSADLSDMWRIGMAIDFAAIDLKWAVRNNLFPIRYSEFMEKHAEVFYYMGENVFPERVLAVRFKEAILRTEPMASENLLGMTSMARVFRMAEREPVHEVVSGQFHRIMHFPSIGLIGHHEPAPKREALGKEAKGASIGPNALRFLQSADLSYFNGGVRDVFEEQEKLNRRSVL